MIELGREIKHKIEQNRPVVHPVESELKDVYGVIFFERVEGGDTLHHRNVTIFADGEVDRSPCGSGTSARLAILDATGELPRQAPLRHDGIAGTTFTGTVVGATEVAGIPAVITEVEGSAYFTGTHEFVLDANDPVGTGFLLR
jgi:proline racemase/trans-L-3-hydroxyproline dehydratase